MEFTMHMLSSDLKSIAKSKKGQINDRILWLDMLRIIAISFIVISHVCSILNIPPFNKFYGITDIYYVTLGGVGVTLFLILSGAAMEYNYYGRISSIESYATYIYKRFIRVYPAYWCSLAIAITVNISLLSTVKINDFFISFIGIHAFLGQWGGYINPVGWFIGLIMILYFLYPAISYFMNKHIYLAIIGLLVISLVSRYYCGANFNNRAIDWFPLCRIFEFGLGVFIIRAGILSGTAKVPETVRFLSNISFGVFLVHYPLLYIAKTSIVFYLVSVLLLSCMLYFFDEKIQYAIRNMIKRRYNGRMPGEKV